MADLAQIFHDLVRFETTLWNSIDARLREQCDLTLARFETMQVIARSGQCRVVDIADELAIGWGGASKIVDRVEAAGHCRRRPNPDDARSSLITLTPSGRALLRQATGYFTTELQLGLATALTPVQLDDLGDGLARLRRRTAATSGGPVSQRRRNRHQGAHSSATAGVPKRLLGHGQ
jgi:DNA-binding MarR family transcriptional regulator